MRIVLGADHAGFELKQDVLSYLRGLGHEMMDVGATSGTQPDDYPDFAEAVGMAVRNNWADRGVLVCGSGWSCSTPWCHNPDLELFAERWAQDRRFPGRTNLIGSGFLE